MLDKDKVQPLTPREWVVVTRGDKGLPFGRGGPIKSLVFCPDTFVILIQYDIKNQFFSPRNPYPREIKTTPDN